MRLGSLIYFPELISICKLGDVTFARFLCHFRKTGVCVGQRFTLQIIRIPGGGHCPFARDSEPIRLLEIPTSPSYMLIRLFITRLITGYPSFLFDLVLLDGRHVRGIR